MADLPDIKRLSHSIVNDDDFPLTPAEAWYVMRGYAVRPARSVTVDELLKLPGVLEMRDGYILMRPE